MNFEFIKTIEFFYSLGYVTACSSLLTMVIMEIIKLILKQFRVINKETNAIKKDNLLSLLGRIIALVSYASIYVIDVLIIKHNELIINEELITSLLSGSALTLCISKGIYTSLRQMVKKKTIFEKLECAEETINNLKKEIEENNKEDNKQKLILGMKEKREYE